jgi:hypothetical protein
MKGAKETDLNAEFTANFYPLTAFGKLIVSRNTTSPFSAGVGWTVFVLQNGIP